MGQVPARGPLALLLALLLGLLLTVAACSDARIATRPLATETPPPVILDLGMTDSAAALADTMAGAYAQEAERAILNPVVGNGGTLRQDLEAQQLDALLVHHIPEGSEHWFNPVALDGLVIVVHPDNPIRSLSLEDVQSLFGGQIENWSGLRGPDLAVEPVVRERGSDDRILFQRWVMGPRAVSINSLVQSDSDSLVEAVAANPGAVGYTMMGALQETVVAVEIGGVSPRPRNTATQSYPLTVPLYFVSPAEPQGELRAFLAWLQSPEGQAIVGEKLGRVS